MSLPHITHRLMFGSVTIWCRKKRDKNIQLEQRRKETKTRCSILELYNIPLPPRATVNTCLIPVLPWVVQYMPNDVLHNPRGVHV